MGKTRLEAFSDGVLAIIITIMVLEMKVPHGAELAALNPLLPVFLSYVLSFVYLAIYWNNHHHMLHATQRVNGAILWATCTSSSGYRFFRSSQAGWGRIILLPHRWHFMVSCCSWRQLHISSCSMPLLRAKARTPCWPRRWAVTSRESCRLCSMALQSWLHFLSLGSQAASTCLWR